MDKARERESSSRFCQNAKKQPKMKHQNRYSAHFQDKTLARITLQDIRRTRRTAFSLQSYTIYFKKGGILSKKRVTFAHLKINPFLFCQ